MRWRRKGRPDMTDDDADGILLEHTQRPHDDTVDRRHPKKENRKSDKPKKGPSEFYPSSPTHRHRDAFGRIHVGPQEDRYIDPEDGSLRALEVQACDYVRGHGGHTWTRLEITTENLPLALASSPYSAYHSYSTAKERNPIDAWIRLACAWIFVCLTSFVLVLLPVIAFEGKKRNDGRYDPFLYKYWGYLELARNNTESQPGNANSTRQGDHWRPIFPRFLCHLRRPELKSMEGVQISSFSDVISTSINHSDVTYAYIAYTSNQFGGVDDFKAIHKMAERATRDAGLSAYWIGLSCMPQPEYLVQDVYNLDSVCRNASVLVVALGNHIDGTPASHKLNLFRDFGSRLWCRPYLLTSPPGARILVYIRGEDPETHLSLSKREFALLVWPGEEVATALRLLDHAEGKLRLGTIEFLVLCVKFLLGGSTSQYLLGDYSYVLMGLLPHRPQIVVTDSGWRSFCRIILANENDRLLERLTCHLSADRDRFWPVADDIWGAQLWEIHPHCQIAGLGQDDTIIVDGAYAAAIRWNSLIPVDYRPELSGYSIVARGLYRSTPVTLTLGFVLTFIGFQQVRIVGLVLIASATVLIVSSPYLVRRLYGFDPKTCSTQPCFFGIEGYVALDVLSAKIFGENRNSPRLRWAPHSSVLHSHAPNEFGECEGLDPASLPHVATLISMSQESRIGEPKLFTLVDTGSMTVTLFMARHPPTVVLCCGQEGGMQRALLCSYEWTTATIYRETVVRMETSVIDRMHKMGRIQLCPEASRPSDYKLNSSL